MRLPVICGVFGLLLGESSSYSVGWRLRATVDGAFPRREGLATGARYASCQSDGVLYNVL